MNKALLALLAAGALTLVGASPAVATEGHGHTPVTICHATASETNPYLTITVDDDSTKLEGHLAHEHDLIPAPAGGCPGPVVPPVVEPPVVVVPPVEVPPVEPPVVEPPIVVVTDPPPIVICSDGAEESNGVCTTPDQPCPGLDACPPVVEPIAPPAAVVPVVVADPPATVAPPVAALTPPAATVPPVDRTVAADRAELASTGFNSWPLMAGMVLLLLGGGLLLRPHAR